jgi:hypothetical protein
MIRYKGGVRPTQAEAAYGAISGLKASREFQPLVTVTGSKDSVQGALRHELTEGAVMNLQEYNRYFVSTGGR